MLVEVLCIVFNYVFPDAYCIGCVRPGNEVHSWRMVYTSTRRQIGSICKELWELIKQQRRRDSLQAPPESPRPPKYHNHYGILPLVTPGQRLKLPKILGSCDCPTCGAPWPTFRWAWADKGSTQYRTVTFCRTDCQQRMFCPPCTAMRPYLEEQQAPEWVIQLYSQGS